MYSFAQLVDSEQYPARQFLELAHVANVPLLINSDSHDPTELTAGFAEAVALAKDTGFTHTVRFAKRVKSLVPLP